MNAHLKRSVAFLTILLISGCTFMRPPPKVITPEPTAESVPWRSEISSQGCPDINGRYKDPKLVLFGNFPDTGHFTVNPDIYGRFGSLISMRRYKLYPYFGFRGDERQEIKDEFDKNNIVKIHVDGDVVTFELINNGEIYRDAKYKSDYFFAGCSQGSHLFRSFSIQPIWRGGPKFAYVKERYIKKENDGTLIIDHYSRTWEKTTDLGRKPDEDRHNRYVLEPVREK